MPFMDDIRRRLAAIDRQLASRTAGYHQQLTATTPLLFCATGLILGILVQSAADAPVWIWLLLLAACAIFAAACFVFRKAPVFVRIDSLYAGAYLALVCFVAVGAVRLTSFYRPAENDIRRLVGDQRTLATLRGQIINEPYTNYRRNWAFSRFRFTDPSSSFYLQVREIDTVAGWTNASGRVRVQVDEPVMDLRAGDYVQLYCWLDRFSPATNPGQFDMAKYAERRAVFVGASVKMRKSIIVLTDGKGLWAKIKGAIRAAATEALVGDIAEAESSRGLLEALLLGYRGDIDTDTYNAFRRTGLLHFLSLSGMHVGILLGVIWWLGKTIGLLKRSRAAVCIVAICIFMCVVPPRAPTVRAVIIGLVYCLSFFFRRRPNHFNTLSLAAIILLLMRPTNLFDAGWQLSFASVLGILLFCRRLHFFLYEKIFGHLWFTDALKTRPFFWIVSRPGPYILQMFSTGLAAWLGGAGILLYHFYTINPLTSVWTVVAFPFVALILTVGFLKILLSFLLPSIAAGLGLIVTGLAEALIWVVEVIARLDISQILIGSVPLLLVLLYYALIMCGAFVYFRHPVIKQLLCGALAVIVIAWLGALKLQRTHRSDLRLTVLDVGHGQAIFAQLPGKENILFDAGSLNRADIGRRIVAAYLRYCSTARLDAIVISHNDIDHINGIPEIAESCNVDAIYANNVFFDKSDEWGTAAFLKETLLKQALAVVPLSVNYDAFERAGITVLWPSEESEQNSELSENDLSVVLLIEFGGRRVLLCSDIESLAQRELLRLSPHLRADIIIAPHHGSAKTAEHEFLQKLEPKIIVCSCGTTAYEKKRVIEPGSPVRTFYTARDGAMTIRITSSGRVTVERFVEP
ncbi:hypothetical protein ES707_22193 [subsurface metagenome]